jgi:hypothetical protein
LTRTSIQMSSRNTEKVFYWWQKSDNVFEAKGVITKVPTCVMIVDFSSKKLRNLGGLHMYLY